jgi:hypothetical protein
VRNLEQRYIESEAVQRRRRQLERAVLEVRLNEEQARRDQLQRAASRSVAVLLAVAASVSLFGVLTVSAAAGQVAGGLWLIVAGVSFLALYLTYVVISRDL